MAKDTFWFKHDWNAGRGLRMLKMAHIYGHEGKGIYWDVIEMLRHQEDYKYACDDSSLQMLAGIIGCKNNEKFLSWYRDCIRIGLFKVRKGYFYSEVLNSNMEVWESKRNNGSAGGKKRAENAKFASSESQANGVANFKHKEKRREEEIREEKKIEDKKNLIFPFKSEGFLLVWNILIKEEKWRGKSFAALQTSLVQLSQHDEITAIEMMKRSIAGGWQGLFDINNTSNGKGINKLANESTDSIKQASERMFGDSKEGG